MNRLISSLLKLFLANSELDILGVGDTTELEPARFDKGGRQFTVRLIATRDR